MIQVCVLHPYYRRRRWGVRFPLYHYWPVVWLGFLEIRLYPWLRAPLIRREPGPNCWRELARRALDRNGLG